MNDPLDIDPLERSLREALRPVEPRASFAARLARALAEAEAAKRPARVRWGRRVALAASVLAGVVLAGLLQQAHEREVARSAAASAQLMQALHLTSRQLERVYRDVHGQGGTDGPGPRA